VIYNQRCTVIIKGRTQGFLGEEKVETKRITLPCGVSSLSSDEQMSFFGKYSKTAMKIHLQGIHLDISQIIYQDRKKDCWQVRFHRNSTVVIIS